MERGAGHSFHTDAANRLWTHLLQFPPPNGVLAEICTHISGTNCKHVDAIFLEL